MKYNVCDYCGFNYKAVFWENQNREYEDYVERQALKRSSWRKQKVCLKQSLASSS